MAVTRAKKKPAAAKKKKTGTKKKSAKGAKSSAKAGKVDFNFKGLSDWNESRKSTGMEDTELEPGDYVAQITAARCGNDGKGQPYFAFNFTILRGDAKGSSVSAYYGLHRVESEKVFVGQLQALGFVTKDLDAKDIPEVAATLSKEKAEVRLQVKHSESDGRTFQNVYIRGLVTEKKS